MRLFIRTIIYFILFISIPFNLLADTEEPNISETLFHHVLNSHDINIIPGTEPIQLPFGMTVHLLMLILAVVIIGRITSYNVCYTKLLRNGSCIGSVPGIIFMS